MFVFFLVMAAIGYNALKIKDNRGRVSISMMLTVVTCVAILCFWLKTALIVR